ncbi:DUF1648 domain-containing protein [Candidatus Pacearchaeota archaeon]|nr:DUF1648 domain-containing protein [Candidatus Pacearchaeota archaeon]MBD3283407.1 DUF1648 domain-containing protein [Candidatus Pacearchaeota archaeon]
MKIKHIPLILVILLFLIGIIIYLYLPEKIASHWNAQREVDAYTSKF